MSRVQAAKKRGGERADRIHLATLHPSFDQRSEMNEKKTGNGFAKAVIRLAIIILINSNTHTSAADEKDAEGKRGSLKAVQTPATVTAA